MEQLQEIKDSYYAYVSKVGDGCLTIANLFRQGKAQNAFESIVAFAEGIEWLVAAESALANEGFTINSRIIEANEFLIEINEALENQDLVTVADLFEYEIHPLFSSASEWLFTKKLEG